MKGGYKLIPSLIWPLCWMWMFFGLSSPWTSSRLCKYLRCEKDKDGERDSLERGENLLAETHPDLEVETGLVMLHVLLQRARSHQFSNVDNTIIFYPEIKSCCDIAVLKSG